jgi:hypothetical protein
MGFNGVEAVCTGFDGRRSLTITEARRHRWQRAKGSWLRFDSFFFFFWLRFDMETNLQRDKLLSCTLFRPLGKCKMLYFKITFCVAVACGCIEPEMELSGT